jgi:hypothetical protein
LFGFIFALDDPCGEQTKYSDWDIEMDAAAAMAQNPRATPRCWIGNSRVTMAMPTGMRNPAPMACIILKKINEYSFQARPHKNDPKVKRNKAKK